MSVITNRTYSVIEVQNGVIAKNTFTFEQIVLDEKSGYEIVYAMQEVFDAILDLQVNDSMYFQPNRDNKSSKGIIVRTK